MYTADKGRFAAIRLNFQCPPPYVKLSPVENNLPGSLFSSAGGGLVGGYQGLKGP